MNGRKIRYWQSKIGWVAIIFLSIFVGNKTAVLAQSEIVPDSSLGDRQTQVTTDPQNADIENIEGGATRGKNLFHSFSEFNVSSGQIANFVNSSEIENIFSRVTGNNPSNILGQLKASGDANLFLLNPNGIIFGEDASLDLGGSFFATTADSFNFADETSFSATDIESNPLLTISIPVGLQFGNDVEGIDLNATSLEVLPNKTLALIGGEIELTGDPNDLPSEFDLLSPGGRIELGSVGANSRVILESNNGFWKANYSQVETFQDINLDNEAEIEASGEGGGEIQIQGSSIKLTQGSGIYADTEGTQAGKGILIRAAEAVTVAEGSSITADVLESATGTGGNIEIETQRLTLQGDDSYISTSSFSQGNGGEMSIVASESLQLKGVESSKKDLINGLYSEAVNTGDAGNIAIATKNLQISNGGQIFVGNDTGSQGDGGNLKINATKSIALVGRSPNGDFASGLFTQANGDGIAGDIEIATEKLTVANGARVSTATFGLNRGGDMFIAAKSVNISGVNANNYPSTLSARTNGDRDAGNIAIKTNTFQVTNGAIVDTRTTDAGNGGNIAIETDSFQASAGGQVFASTLEGSSGNGGNIEINTAEELVISGETSSLRRIRVGDGSFLNEKIEESGLYVRSQGTGEAGDIKVKSGVLEISDRGIISGETLSGKGGNVSLQIQDFLLLRRGSKITTTASNDGDGGNIKIDSPLVVAFPAENSDITANAFNGSGGSIEIFSEAILGLESRTQLSATSDITAFSTQNPNLNGIIELNIAQERVLQELTKLPDRTIDVSQSIIRGCSTNDNGDRFVVTGKGGLAPSPTESLRSSAIRATSTEGSTNNHRVTEPASIVEAQGWKINNRGNVVLIADANSTNSTNSPTVGCMP